MKETQYLKANHMTNGLTEEQVLEYVTHHPDGFDYAQLQTGIGRFELEELMLQHGFEKCDFCLEEWGIDQCPYTDQMVCFFCRKELKEENWD